MKPEEENCTARVRHCMRWLNIGMGSGQDFLPSDVCEPDQEDCFMMHMKCLHLLVPAEGTPRLSPVSVRNSRNS
ncbi:hypothetical protein E2C01_095951 [Portunus trituberculatus]|uniref:Uncharacterized protein n=1 Tax=Portunus trituberculatus TaxID=210409 RepID=A0A5B7K5C5_PORTR|nr:hypothetical protein [Portunus trituberculatus]